MIVVKPPSINLSASYHNALERLQGHMVDFSLSLLAIEFTQPSSPSGSPRCAACRIASSSCPVSGSLTCAARSGSPGNGQEERSFGFPLL